MLFLLILLFMFKSGSILCADTIRAEIEIYLKEQLKGYEKFEFEIVSTPLVKSDEKIKIDEERQLRLTGNLAYIPVKITNKSGRTSQSIVSVKVKLYRKVLSAMADIRYGTELNIRDFEEKLADVAQIRGSIVTDPFQLSDSKAKSNIRQGEILTKEAMKPKPILKSGEKVSAIYINGNVVITMDAVSKQDGCAGDIIRIITSDKKLFRAKVIDANSVKIEE